MGKLQFLRRLVRFEIGATSRKRYAFRSSAELPSTNQNAGSRLRSRSWFTSLTRCVARAAMSMLQMEPKEEKRFFGLDQIDDEMKRIEARERLLLSSKSPANMRPCMYTRTQGHAHPYVCTRTPIRVHTHRCKLFSSRCHCPRLRTLFHSIMTSLYVVSHVVF